MYVYIFKSVRTGHYYTGSTHDLQERLREHNNPHANPSRWTRRGAPWELVFSAHFSTVAAALQAEKFIKRQKSRRFIEQLLSGERQLLTFDKSREPA